MGCVYSRIVVGFDKSTKLSNSVGRYFWYKSELLNYEVIPLARVFSHFVYVLGIIPLGIPLVVS